MNDLVDVAGLGGKQQDAEHRTEALDRHSHRHDQLALFGDPHHRAAATGQSIHHLGIDRAVGTRRLAVERQITALEKPVEPCGDFGQARGHGLGRGQVVAQHLAACVKVARIENQAGIIIIDAGAGAGRRDQPASTGATRSGLIGKSRFSLELVGEMLWPACSSSSFSGRW
jgi:hypothetical protein